MDLVVQETKERVLVQATTYNLVEEMIFKWNLMYYYLRQSYGFFRVSAFMFALR